MNRARLLAYATALSAIVGWGLLAPQPAQAQLGSLIVTITSPAAGSTVTLTLPLNPSVSILGSLTVRGAVPVTASVMTIIAALTVRGMQFKLDGANLGADDKSAPYSVSWNTTTASNGSHTLTAVATDILGVQRTSQPVTVTVSNASPPTITSFTPASGPVGTSVTLSGTAGGTKTVTVSGGPSTYNVAVSGMTTSGTVLASIPAGVANDAAGNLNTASTSTDNSVTFTLVSPTVLENQQPGSGNWQMWLHGIPPADDVNQQIKGYASATSVNPGESITFYVTVNHAQQYTMDVYRMGWYQGLGGRLMQSIGPLQGVAQPACPADSVTGLIECDWTASYTLTVPPNWTSGVFMVQLTNAQGYQNYITFVVRDDARVADIMFQQAVATYQAYNNYPDDNATGKSLYDFNSYGANTVTGTPRAAKVSWNRPYTQRGAGQFFSWEVYFIRWLEQSGYDVKYSTDVDTHENSGRLLNSKVFLSGGHNEYWSKPMYDGVQQARDAGIHLGFFGADAVFWQVRFEASPLSRAADG